MIVSRSRSPRGDDGYPDLPIEPPMSWYGRVMTESFLARCRATYGHTDCPDPYDAWVDHQMEAFREVCADILQIESETLTRNPSHPERGLHDMWTYAELPF